MAKKKASRKNHPQLIKLREFGVRLEEQKQVIARERDKLRQMLGEYTDIVDNCDFADEDLVLAKDYIDSAVDKLSELV